MVYGVVNLNKRQKLVLFLLPGFVREEKKKKNQLKIFSVQDDENDIIQY